MDKFILAHLLKDLILETGQAVLPGFGIFTAEPVEASFSEDGRIINPPTYRIIFTENTAAGGDLLLERYAAKMEESPDSLRSRLESIVREIMDETVGGGSMTFAGFGTLAYHDDGTFSFQSENGKDFFMERDGLEPIQLRIIERQTEPDRMPEPLAEQLAEPLPGPVSEPTRHPISEPKPQDAPEDRRHRLQVTIIIVLSVIIIGAILMILGRNGVFDALLYTDEELELIHSSEQV